MLFLKVAVIKKKKIQVNNSDCTIKVGWTGLVDT